MVCTETFPNVLTPKLPKPKAQSFSRENLMAGDVSERPYPLAYSFIHFPQYLKKKQTFPRVSTPSPTDEYLSRKDLMSGDVCQFPYP